MLQNEYNILSKISHPNIIKALNYHSSIIFPDFDINAEYASIELERSNLILF